MYYKYVLQGTKDTENGLYIVNARYQNEGVYECEVRTPLNTVTATTTLIVYGTVCTFIDNTGVCYITSSNTFLFLAQLFNAQGEL